MSMWTQVRKHSVSELSKRMQDGAPAIFSSVLRDVLSNIYHDRWIGRGPTEWPSHQPDFNPLDFYLLGHLKPLCMQRLLTQKRRFIALRMPVRLSATAPPSLNGCGSAWWNVSRRALNLTEVMSRAYYKYTLSAITRKRNFSGHKSIRTYFLFCYVELVPKIYPLIPVTARIYMYMYNHRPDVCYGPASECESCLWFLAASC
jgi:hypothetical protein